MKIGMFMGYCVELELAAQAGLSEQVHCYGQYATHWISVFVAVFNALSRRCLNRR